MISITKNKAITNVFFKNPFLLLNFSIQLITKINFHKSSSKNYIPNFSKSNSHKNWLPKSLLKSPSLPFHQLFNPTTKIGFFQTGLNAPQKRIFPLTQINQKWSNNHKNWFSNRYSKGQFFTSFQQFFNHKSWFPK